MSTPPVDPDKNPELTPDGDTPPGAPRWVKTFGIVVLVLVLLVVIMMATGVGGHHGPGRHMRFGHTGASSPPAAGVQRP